MSKIFTSSDLAAYMNMTLVDAVAQQVVISINQWIENRTNRCWGELVTATNERHDWAPSIWTNHQDVSTAANSMTIILGYPNLQTSTLTSTSFFWNNYGRVTMYLQNPSQFNPSAVNNDLVQITYTYGVAVVPDDLVMAALGVAAGFYNWATNGQKDIVAASVGSYKLTYAGAVRGVGGGPDGNAPPASMNTNQANWEIIESYRTRRL